MVTEHRNQDGTKLLPCQLALVSEGAAEEDEEMSPGRCVILLTHASVNNLPTHIPASVLAKFSGAHEKDVDIGGRFLWKSFREESSGDGND